MSGGGFQGRHTVCRGRSLCRVARVCVPGWFVAVSGWADDAAGDGRQEQQEPLIAHFAHSLPHSALSLTHPVAFAARRCHASRSL